MASTQNPLEHPRVARLEKRLHGKSGQPILAVGRLGLGGYTYHSCESGGCYTQPYRVSYAFSAGLINGDKITIPPPPKPKPWGWIDQFAFPTERYLESDCYKSQTVAGKMLLNQLAILEPIPVSVWEHRDGYDCPVSRSSCEVLIGEEEITGANWEDQLLVPIIKWKIEELLEAL